MKQLAIAAALLWVPITPSYALAENGDQSVRVASDVVHHGGGCRKSSPPGQCCHMDRKTGVVHCH